jgi:IclR family transcriptional regulator, blcABC operon repressor
VVTQEFRVSAGDRGVSAGDRGVSPDDRIASPAPAVTRAAALLDELAAAEEPLGLSDIARRLGIAKSSAANLCTALEDAGLIRRVDSRFSLGHKLVELAGSYLRKVDLLTEFHSGARSLPNAAQETMLLGLLDATDVLYLARHDGTQPIRLASDVGRRMPAVCTGLGKAMLSTLSESDVRERVGALAEFPVLTERGAQNIDELLDDLARTRARGYAFDDEENTAGVCCIAVALPGGMNPPHAVSATLLKARLTDRLREQLVADLRDLARKLPKRLDLGPGDLRST